MLTQLLVAQEPSSLGELFDRLFEPDLSIVDRVGTVPSGHAAANVFSERGGHASTEKKGIRPNPVGDIEQGAASWAISSLWRGLP